MARLHTRGRGGVAADRPETLPERPAAVPAPSTPGGVRLGDLLVTDEVITADQLTEALFQQSENGKRLGEVLVGMGLVDEQQLTVALARQYGLEVADLSQLVPNPEVAQRLPESVSRGLNVVAIRDIEGVLEVAAGELRPGLQAEVESAVHSPVRIIAATPGAVQNLTDRIYRALAGADRLIGAFEATEGRRNAPSEAARAEVTGSDAPVAQLVTMIVTQALRDRTSDVHLEPTDGSMRVRFRIDGALHDILALPVSMAGALVSRVKILAGMNIVERRKAQDGQFTTEVDGRNIDVRVSTMATVWGEKCVLRILDKRRSLLHLHELGMPDDTHQIYNRMAHSPFGMLLCAGPTGSGKTTTLYATLGEIDNRELNIVTIEDPVEYVFPSINQVQTNEQAGIGFADGLRAILRQDPDVILVGEIRDIDTARTAVQAALTGHLVLSSLHATDSVAALHRFLDMGIEAFLVASSVLGVVSQRLVRRICPSCVMPYEPTAEELAFYHESGGPEKDSFVHGTGCGFCAQTGYQDRIGVYELLAMTPEIRRLLVGWATQDELRRMATSQGMRTLRDEGIALVARDVTTVSEVIRSIYTTQ